jgi:hypothetical protein
MKRLFKNLLLVVFVFSSVTSVHAVPKDCRFVRDPILRGKISEKVCIPKDLGFEDVEGLKVDDEHISYIIDAHLGEMSMLVLLVDGEGEQCGSAEFSCVPQKDGIDLIACAISDMSVDDFFDSFKLRRGTISSFSAGCSAARLTSGKVYYWSSTDHKLSKEQKEGYEEILINMTAE